MPLTGLDLLFWAAGLGTHLILLYVLLVRHRIKVFPIFTTFILSNVVRTVALYLIESHGNRGSYFKAYWSLAVLDTVLQLSVIYEMCSITFRPLGEWARDLRGAFAWLIGGSIAIAAGLTWLAAPHARLSIQAIVIKGNFFSSACLSTVFVGMVALSVKAGLPWKTHVAKISQGLGVYSIIDVLIEAGHSYFGVSRNTQTYTALSHLRIAAYLCCVAYWIITLWRNPPMPRKLPERLHGQLIQLQTMVDLDLKKIRTRQRW